MAERQVSDVHLNVVKQEAYRITAKMTPGMGVDLQDLESAGNFALVAFFKKNADLPDENFARKMRIAVRMAMFEEIRRITHRGRAGPCGVAYDEETGDELHPVVADADDPLDAMAAREEVETLMVKYEYLPSPTEAAAKADALKRVVIDSISAVDLRLIIDAQVEKAKGGDVAAARFILQLVSHQK